MFSYHFADRGTKTATKDPEANVCYINTQVMCTIYYKRSATQVRQITGGKADLTIHTLDPLDLVVLAAANPAEFESSAVPVNCKKNLDI